MSGIPQKYTKNPQEIIKSLTLPQFLVFLGGFPSKTLKDLVLPVPATFVNLSPSLPRPRRDGETPGISGDRSPKDPLYSSLCSHHLLYTHPSCLHEAACGAIIETIKARINEAAEMSQVRLSRSGRKKCPSKTPSTRSLRSERTLPLV